MEKRNHRDIISLSELGCDTTGWRVRTADLYQMDVEFCHQKPVDYNERYEKTVSCKLNEFAAYGKIAHFDWVALTQVYSKTLFKSVTGEKQKQNEKHLESIAMGYQLGQYLSQAIQNDSMLNIRLSQGNFAVPDTSGLAWKGIHEHTGAMVHHIRKFLGMEWDEGIKLGVKENKLVATDGELTDLKGKDVILPFIYANHDSISLYGELANIICNFAKANTVTGVFITRIMPTMDGRRTNSLAPDEYVPIISPFFGMEIPPLGF